MKTLRMPARNLSVIDSADVAVVGGGPSGFSAAIAAAREGSSVYIIEKNGYCGGVAAMGLPIQGFDDVEGNPLVRGIAWELYQRLIEAGGALKELVPCRLHNPFAIIDPHICKLVIEEMLKEAGVKVWNHTAFLHTLGEPDLHGGISVKNLVVGGKGGLFACKAEKIIDASGDGDAAADAGAQYTIGREPDGLTQSATLNFQLSGIDFNTLGAAVHENFKGLFDTHELINREAICRSEPHIMVGLRNLISEAKLLSGMDIPCDFISYITGIHPGTVCINMVHVHHASGHTLQGLSSAEALGKAQINLLVRFFREWVPGFSQAYISDISPHIGIRETRHILGEYTLTGDDIRSGSFPDDTIALGGYPIDIHHPEKGDVALERVPPYGIPFRTMVPKRVRNMLVTGRAFSADHIALASSRLMATCMALGQAAGTAAHFAAADKSGIEHTYTIDTIQNTLESRGAVIRK